MTSTTERARTQGLRRARRLRLRRRRSDRGAALVEFAMIALPLFTILFGTIEFGWTMYQYNDIRHGAREGIRLVAVASDITPTESYSGNGERLAQATCERMSEPEGVEITIELTDLESTSPPDYDVGDDVRITARKDLDQLTMLFDPVIGGIDIEEVVTSRLEQSPPDGLAIADYPCKV